MRDNIVMIMSLIKEKKRRMKKEKCLDFNQPFVLENLLEIICTRRIIKGLMLRNSIEINLSVGDMCKRIIKHYNTSIYHFEY